MKNKIISVLLSITIVLSTILQPIVVRANPVVYVGGGLFALLMTALAHAGYTVENQDSANYIYDFFFKKWLSDEDLKEIGLEGQSNAKEFWDGIAEKLTTPLDSKYPSLKGVFEYKVASVGAKIVANCTPALKQAIDQLVQDLPDNTLVDLGSLSSVPVQSLPFTLNNCYFPTLEKAKDGYSLKTTPYIKIKVNRTSVDCIVRIKFDTKFNNEDYSTSLGQIISIGLPSGTDEFSIYNSNRGRDYDNINEIHWDSNLSSNAIFTIANAVRSDNSNYDRNYSFTIDSVVGGTINSLEICDSLWEIPFNEGSKALYRDNEAIWEQMGSIEAKLDDVISQPLTDSYPQSIGMTFPLTQEVADTYVQEKDEIDIKSKDEVEEEESNVPVTPEVEMGGIYENSGKLTDKFPFCIPFDIAKCITGFSRTGNPVVKFSIPFPYVKSFDVNIDLSDYETPLSILRFFELLGFIIGLLVITRNNIIKG